LLALTAFAAAVNTVPPLITSISSDSGFAFEAFGGIFSVQFAAFAVAAYLLTFAAKRLRNGMAGAVFWGILGMGLVLVSIIIIRRFFFFYVWAAFLGFACGFVEPGSTVLISVLEKPGSSRLINLSQAFYCIGAIAAPQVVALVLHLELPWNLAFVILAGFIVLIAGLFRLLLPNGALREKYEDHYHQDINENAPGLLRSPLFLPLSAAIFLYVFVEGIFVVWLPALFEETYSLAPASAAIRLSVYWFGLIVGRLGVVALADRVPKWLIVLSSCLAFTLLTAGMLIMGSAISGTVVVLFLGLAAGPIWPGIVSIAGEYSRQARFTSTLIGIGALGLVFGPMLSGWIIRVKGFDVLMMMLVAVLGIMSALMFWSYARRKQALPE
ncbi:MAG: MFS transporter, partial [Spirochaetales bacterium]|nr:MFS transporter [Spirochaetales bacterium]